VGGDKVEIISGGKGTKKINAIVVDDLEAKCEQLFRLQETELQLPSPVA
jgi:membrane protein involved in colicin uptake